MSDFCKECTYDVKEKYNNNACPFNGLYWNFIHDQKETFEKTRQNFVLKNLDKIDINKIKKNFK